LNAERPGLADLVRQVRQQENADGINPIAGHHCDGTLGEVRQAVCRDIAALSYCLGYLRLSAKPEQAASD
jgi:hypothetical protein